MRFIAFNCYLCPVRLTLYFLVFTVFMNNCMAQQVLRIPILFQHYIEHQDQDRDLTFMDYLDMHYGGQHPDDDDDSRDTKLPFKKAHTSAHSHFDFIPVAQPRLVLRVTPFRKPSESVHRNNLFHNPHLGELFRPPIA